MLLYYNIFKQEQKDSKIMQLLKDKTNLQSEIAKVYII